MSGKEPSDHVYYAHKTTRTDGGVRYYHASTKRWWVALFGSNDPIVSVRIRERHDGDPPSSYFGWVETSEPDRYSMVFPTEIQFETCFQYSSRDSENRGYGRKVNLIVEEIVA